MMTTPPLSNLLPQSRACIGVQRHSPLLWHNGRCWICLCGKLQWHWGWRDELESTREARQAYGLFSCEIKCSNLQREKLSLCSLEYYKWIGTFEQVTISKYISRPAMHLYKHILFFELSIYWTISRYPQSSIHPRSTVSDFEHKTMAHSYVDEQNKEWQVQFHFT